jgi:beta-lactamase regulating signal transducer with metallopeptidase domain
MEGVLLYLLKSSIVLACFQGIYFLFLRDQTWAFAKRFYLLLGVLTAVLFPLFYITHTIQLETTFSQQNSLAPLTSMQPDSVLENTSASNALSMGEWLFLLYLLGVASLLFYYGKSLLCLLSWLRNHPLVKRNGCRFIYTQRPVAPFSIFNYIVINPEHYGDLDRSIIETHETVHVKQYHWVDTLLSTLFCCLLWWNPLVWHYRKLISENLEYLADAHSVAQLQDSKKYQFTLVKAAVGQRSPALSIPFYQSINRWRILRTTFQFPRSATLIKKRIVMLNKQPTQKRNFLATLFLLPLLAVFLYSFNVRKEYVHTSALPAKATNASLETTESPIPSEKIPFEKSHLSSEEKTPTNAQPSPQHVVKGISRPMASSSSNTNDVKAGPPVDIQITKNTSLEELRELQQQLMDEHGIEFEFSNVNYNENAEITSISIAYQDKYGNNSNYTVQGDGPINTIILTVSEDGRLRMHSEMTEAQRKRFENRRERRDQQMEMRKERLEERRQQMKQRMDSAYGSVDRMEAMKQRMEERKRAVESRMAARAFYRGNENRQDNNDRSLHGIVTMDKGTLVIDKTTTDAELARKKAELAERGITFTYKKVTRNEAGEITGIKLSVDDGEGSESNTTVKTDNGEPIDTIVIKL